MNYSKMSNTEEWQDEISHMENCDTFYEILKVHQNATVKEIEESYKKIRLIFESAKNSSTETEDGLHKLKQAYDTLSDEKCRERYDRTLNVDKYVNKVTEAEEKQQEEEKLLPEQQATKKDDNSLKAQAAKRRAERIRFADEQEADEDIEVTPAVAEEGQVYVAVSGPARANPAVIRSRSVHPQNHPIIYMPEESFRYRVIHYLGPWVCALLFLAMILTFLAIYRPNSK